MIRDFYLTHIPIQLNAVIGGYFFYIKKNCFVCKFVKFTSIRQLHL